MVAGSSNQSLNDALEWRPRNRRDVKSSLHITPAPRASHPSHLPSNLRSVRMSLAGLAYEASINGDSIRRSLDLLMGKECEQC